MNGDEEQRWRALLERAVPALPAPGDRLGQVRWRIRRRRRRRAAAGAAALAVAGAATVASLVRPPAASAPPAAPRPAATYDDRAARFPALSGLTVRLAPGWQAGDVTDPATGETFGVAATRPLPDGLTCAKNRPKDTPCAPPVALARGDALLVLRTGTAPDAAGPRLQEAKAPGAVCRSLGATRQWDAARTLTRGDDRPPVTVRASLCARDAPTGARGAAEDILGAARLGDGPPTGGPGAAR